MTGTPENALQESLFATVSCHRLALPAVFCPYATGSPMRLVESGVIDLDFQAQEDIASRAKTDSRFGAVLPGTFGEDPNWDPNYELRWMDFNFSGSRVVRIYHATFKANSAYRLTIFWDPDTNNWTSWARAF